MSWNFTFSWWFNPPTSKIFYSEATKWRVLSFKRNNRILIYNKFRFWIECHKCFLYQDLLNYGFWPTYNFITKMFRVVRVVATREFLFNILIDNRIQRISYKRYPNLKFFFYLNQGFEKFEILTWVVCLSFTVTKRLSFLIFFLY